MRYISVLLTVWILLLPAVSVLAAKQKTGETAPARPFDDESRTNSKEFTWATDEATSHGAPSWMGDPNYWGNAECAIFYNDVGTAVTLSTIRFMCTNDDTDSSYWGVNIAVSGYQDTASLESVHISEWSTSGLYTSAEGYTGSPPTSWTEVTPSGYIIIIPDGSYFAVAYGLDEDETASGSLGLTDDAGDRYTYSVYAGAWDWDQDPDNLDPGTAVLNAVVTYGPVDGISTTSYGRIKALFE
jgi:hypothetical protein